MDFPLSPAENIITERERVIGDPSCPSSYIVLFFINYFIDWKHFLFSFPHYIPFSVHNFPHLLNIFRLNFPLPTITSKQS